MMALTELTKDWNINRKNGIQYGLVVAWMLAMIAVPILKWTYGEEVIPTAITIALMVQFTAVTFAMFNGWGMRRTLIALGIVAVLTWLAEFIGSSTGLPFGEYEYSNLLQPQVGHVPLLIPLAWFMMLVPSWAVAQIIGGRDHPVRFIVISAGAMTAWDLFLDPQMVAWGFWTWTVDGAYFGIPLMNYFGWLLVSAIVTAAVRPYRHPLPLAPLLTVYAVVWFLQSVGQAAFWGQPGPALVGGVVMGAFLFTALYRYWKAPADGR